MGILAFDETSALASAVVYETLRRGLINYEHKDSIDNFERNLIIEEANRESLMSLLTLDLTIGDFPELPPKILILTTHSLGDICFHKTD